MFVYCLRCYGFFSRILLSYFSVLTFYAVFLPSFSLFFFFNDPATPEIYPLPLHDPLPIKENVVDADAPLFAQLHIVREGRALVHREPQPEVGVVIRVRARRYDPVDDPRLDEGDHRGHAKPSRRHRTGQAHADRDVLREHPLREQATALGQPARVIGQERVVDELGDRFLASDRPGVDTRAAQVVLACRHRLSTAKDSVRRARALTQRRTASSGSSVT